MRGKNIVYNGCDLLDTEKAHKLLDGKRLGLLTNMSGVTRELRMTSEAVAAKYHLCALFGPEHGIRGAAQGGGLDKEIFYDKETGVPVYSIFVGGDTRKSASEAIESLDAVLFDIQDIGVRYYTYQYSMLVLMCLCAEKKKQVIILDRINPIGGMAVRGGVMTAECSGEMNGIPGQPVEMGLTIGEIASYFNETLSIGCNVAVIGLEGWKREMYQDDTDLFFIAPSPNLPSLEAAILYGGTCLFEGTNLSEGRGTTKPYEMFGAPWLDGTKLANAATAEIFEPVILRPCSFTPTFDKFKGELCGGVQIHIKDRAALNSPMFGLKLLELIRELYPQDFSYREGTIKRLFGNSSILSEKFTSDSYMKAEEPKLAAFRENRKKWLLY